MKSDMGILVIFVMMCAYTTKSSCSLATTEASVSPTDSGLDSHRSFCCDALATAGFSERVQHPGEQIYEDSISSYWAAQTRLRPNCILRPSDSAEVAKAIRTLVETNKTHPCQFAVRSGGHTGWTGAANIENGVTIDLSLMNGTTYFAENNTASIQPGARWNSVYSVLDRVGAASAGGRAGSVGVAGLVLGGGNSFFSGRKGMVCDNVVSFEIVLGNGEIVSANNQTNSDLFRALKGGSGNFGVVTRIDMSTFDGGNLWGGVVIYPNTTASQQAKALVNFVDNLEEDPYASAIVQFIHESKLDETVVATAYEYTKPVERAAIFEEFLSIQGNISDTMRITNMTDLTGELEQSSGFRISFHTATIQNDERIVRKVIELFNLLVEQVKPDGGDSKSYLIFQPLPTLYAKRSVERGGNVLGLDSFAENSILILLEMAWKGAEVDELFYSAANQFIDDVHAFSKSIGKDNPFIYLDYAFKTQKPLESYGLLNVENMRAVSAKYDPEGVFQNMVPGGFKISKVQTAFEKVDTIHDEL